MPLILPDGLPAIDMLKRENINIEDMLAKEDDKTSASHCHTQSYAIQGYDGD